MLTANGATGVLHDCFCYNDAGLVWNGTAFVAWVDANYLTYRVAATERGTSGTFTATEPAGTSIFELRVRGASLAASYVVWAESIELLKIPRAAAPVTAGAPQAKHLENSLGATLQSVREVFDGDAS